MPPPINEVDVDYDAQIQEIRRLISSSSDPDRRVSLEEQLRELELASVQADQLPGIVLVGGRQERRKSFRPPSAKPRMALTSLTEDREVNLSSMAHHGLDSYGPSPTTCVSNLVLEVMATSHDEQYAPSSVLSSDHHSFWITSGVYPQVLRLTLREPMVIREVEVSFRYVRKLQLRTAPSRTNSRKLSAVLEKEVPVNDSSKLTTHSFPLQQDRAGGDVDKVEVIEVGIESAYDDFAIVYVVNFHPTGDAENGR